jgi:hypothetical protein
MLRLARNLLTQEWLDGEPDNFRNPQRQRGAVCQFVLSWNAPFGRSKLSVKMTALLEALAANGVRHMWL